MSDTLGYILEAVIGLTVGGVGMYFLARHQSRRFAESLAAIAWTPPCINCGEPTGSPRLSECDKCHGRRILAEFDAMVAESQRRIDLGVAHTQQLDNEIEEVPDPEGARTWVERRLTGQSRATCTCGLDTGLIDTEAARNAFKEHYTQTQGVPWPA